MKQQLIETCENKEYSVRLGLTAEGELLVSDRDGSWENVEFCKKYAGYYAARRFTAIALGDGQFYAAGTDTEGMPHLFTSLMGGVWDETLLIDVTAEREEQCASGNIVRILYEAEENQVYLISETGHPHLMCRDFLARRAGTWWISGSTGQNWGFWNRQLHPEQAPIST